jgi:flagellar basal-body rod protein FlgF
MDAGEFHDTGKASCMPPALTEPSYTYRSNSATELALVPFRHILVTPNAFPIELIGALALDAEHFSFRPLNCFSLPRRQHIMEPLISAAASGIRARIESLDMLANNIANSSAPGFKADREFYSLYTSADAADSPDGTTPSTLPVIERQWTDFRQGSLTPTSNPLDVALDGQGFFIANSPSGPVYTRGGSLRLSPSGQLETMDGYAIQGQDGKPIQLDSSKPIDIGPDGAINQDGAEVAHLAVVNFNNDGALTKRGNSYFQVDIAGLAPTPASNTQVRQGQIEAANSQPAESAVRLVNVMRQFESLQKALAIGNDMDRRAVEEVAKVTS